MILIWLIGLYVFSSHFANIQHQVPSSSSRQSHWREGKGSFCERKPNQLENRQLSSILGENQTLSGARSVLATRRLNIILDEVLKEIFVVARVEAQWLYRDFSVQITECK